MKKGTPTRSKRLARKLKQIRTSLRLSQSEVLDRLGFADQLFRSNISQYENGHRTPAPPVLLAYSRLANVDLAILIDDKLNLPKDESPASKKAGVRRSTKTPTKRKPKPPKRRQ
jgi:transcriptional regulator with XRE-family HTH domain